MKILTISTPLNYDITVSEFTSESNSDVVIICSATGVLQGYYSKFATFLSKNGLTTYTFDYSGIGASKKQNIKKHTMSLSNWATNDIETILQKIKQWHPSKKIHFVGHSLGGQLLSLAPSNKIIYNTILVASQTNYFGYWNGFFNKLRVFTNWFIIFPLFTSIFSYLPSKKIIKMEDLPKNVATEFSAWSRNKNYYFDVKSENELHQNQLTKNITIYSCDNDKFAPKRAVNWLANTFTKAKVTRKHLLAKDYKVKNIGHFGFFKSQFEDTIWQEFLTSLKA